METQEKTNKGVNEQKKTSQEKEKRKMEQETLLREIKWTQPQLELGSFCSKTELAFPPPVRDAAPAARNMPTRGSQQNAAVVVADDPSP